MENDSLNLAMNIASMRHEVLLRTVCALIRQLPKDARDSFGTELTAELKALMAQAGDLSHPDIDAIVLLDMKRLADAAHNH